jgi:hypothetical protein
LERTQVPSAKISQRTHQDEVKLINSLYKNGATEGLIGINARAALKRMPSAIYWQGLGAWGLRLFPGAQASYHRSLDGFYAANRQAHQFHTENWAEDDIHEMHLRQVCNWHPGLQDLRPDNFPAEVTFSLSPEEAQFLQECIMSSQPGSLLACFVAETAPLPKTTYPWEQPAAANLSPHLQEQLEHARIFSLVSYGAPLLYNLIHPDEPLGNPNFNLNTHYSSSLKLSATFGDNNEAPPAAYYSEAHLDTLGLCVYLALAKQSDNAIVVLDDVLTSVDSPHLRRIIDLINYGYMLCKNRHEYPRSSTSPRS